LKSRFGISFDFVAAVSKRGVVPRERNVNFCKDVKLAVAACVLAMAGAAQGAQPTRAESIGAESVPPASVPAASVPAAGDATSGAAASAATQEAGIAEVLVTGERPGPGMWRIAKDGHELWILATLEPLPKDLTWRSRDVDARIAASQTVLAPPDLDVDIGFFRGLTLLPSLLHARKNSDGQTLEQVLPHDLYIRWLALKVKYLGRWSGDEHVRPIVAAHELYTHAVEDAGLTEDERVWDSVKDAAHRHRVAITPITLKLPVDDPKGMIKKLADISPEAEIACLATTMTRLETDLASMRRRANLWAVGDIEGLRALPYADQDAACFDAVSSVPALRDRVAEVKDRLRALWLTTADAAIAKNASSVAVLPITILLKPDGLLAELQARGYTVDAP
jgi:hypothetical protein